MLDVFESNLINHHLLNQKDRIVLGVSGGPDSMAMLNLFLGLREKWSLGLFVVHINHGFRGELAERDAKSVETYCDLKHIPFYRFDYDVMALAKEEGMSFEEAGRKVRYQAFEEVRRNVDAQRIAVAQNKNDQAETILMRMMRGTGIDGLKGIPLQRGPYIIRPILFMKRDEIEAYCELNNVPVCHDHTNDETIYTRNKIRHELLPYIEENFNGQIVEGLYRLGGLLAADAEYIESSLDEKLKSLSIDLKLQNGIPVSKLFKWHDAILSRFVRRVLVLYGHGLKDVSQKHLDEVVDMIRQNRHGKRKLVSGIEFSLEYDTLYFQKFTQEQSTQLINQNCLSVRVVDRSHFETLVLEKNEISIDWDLVQGEISARFRKDGDKFQPLGMNGTKKLKKFFIDQKIPVEQRNKTPLICDAYGIIWVVGYRLSERVRVRKNTRRVGIIMWSECC